LNAYGFSISAITAVHPSLFAPRAGFLGIKVCTEKDLARKTINLLVEQLREVLSCIAHPFPKWNETSGLMQHHVFCGAQKKHSDAKAYSWNGR
jgi:hypothetical protein